MRDFRVAFIEKSFLHFAALITIQLQLAEISGTGTEIELKNKFKT